MKDEISIYIHIPFCSRKCVYCDFASSTRTELIEDYFEALEKEIEMYREFLENKRIITIYFGGGTPSRVSTNYVERTLEKLATFAFMDVKEATFEFNPEDVNYQLVKELKELGINRASVGLQSSSNDILKALGRPYTFEEFRKAYDLLRSYFKNVNVDLMYSLPFERVEDVELDLKTVDVLSPPHVSFYELEIHEDVPLFSMVKSRQVRLPSEDESETMYDLIVMEMEKTGYHRYEISSWTKGMKCLHNVRYWKNEDYIGFGLSAGSHVKGKRWVNISEIGKYISLVKSGVKPIAYESLNTPFQEVLETLFMGLRLAEGVNVAELRKEFGEDFEKAFARIKKFCGEILECYPRLKFTKLGMKFSAMVLRELA